MLENIINTGLVVIGLTLVEMFYHLSGWNPESYFIHSKGVVAKFGLDVVFPITIEQTLYRFIASVLDYFFLRIDDKKIAYNDTEQFNNWLVPSTDWRDKKENEYYTLYTWKGFGFLYLLGLKLPVYVSKRIVSEQFGKQGVYQIQMTHFMHLAVAVKKYPIESELLMLDDTISDLQWDIRKLERNLEVYQGESKLSDRDREIKGGI